MPDIILRVGKSGPMENVKEVAQYINDHYGTKFHFMDIIECELDLDLTEEIINNTWTDTCVRERLISEVFLHHIGLEVPCYGSDEVEKETFYLKLAEIS